MALSNEVISETIKKFQQHPSDTASPQVQIALLTKRLEQLNAHFKGNKHDHHSRRGLLKLVGQRRRLLDYIRARKPEAYRSLIGELGIRK